MRIDRLLVHTHHAGRARGDGRRRRTCSSCSGSAARRRATSRRCSACRCSPPRSPRCCGSRCASGSPTSRRAASTASGTRPTRCIRTFGSRLTRALPLDELLLQLAESLKKTMDARASPRCGRAARRRARARGVGARPRARATLALGAEEETVVARAGVSGAAWAQRLAARGARRPTTTRCCGSRRSRTRGELLGMIVVRRPQGALPFDEARRPGAHRARAPGRARAAQREARLRAPGVARRGAAPGRRAARARAPASSRPATRERRRIERDLHDGAQQHLVALAVSVQPRPPDRRHRSRRRQGDARPDRRATCRRRCRSCATSRTASTRRCSWTAACPRRCAPPAGRAALPTGGRGRGHRPLPAAGRGRGLLLLPRGAAERGASTRARAPRR